MKFQLSRFIALGFLIFFAQLGKSEMYVDGQKVSEATQEWVATREQIVPGSTVRALVCCNNPNFMADLSPWSYPHIFLMQIRMSKNSEISFLNSDGKLVGYTCGSERKCYDSVEMAGTRRGSNGLYVRYYCNSRPDTDMSGRSGIVGIGINKGEITIDDMPNAPDACGGSVLTNADAETTKARKKGKGKRAEAPKKNYRDMQYADSGEGNPT